MFLFNLNLESHHFNITFVFMSNLVFQMLCFYMTSMLHHWSLSTLQFRADELCNITSSNLWTRGKFYYLCTLTSSSFPSRREIDIQYAHTHAHPSPVAERSIYNTHTHMLILPQSPRDRYTLCTHTCSSFPSRREIDIHYAHTHTHTSLSFPSRREIDIQYAHTQAHPSPVAERCTLARIQVPHILAIFYNLINWDIVLLPSLTIFYNSTIFIVTSYIDNSLRFDHPLSFSTIRPPDFIVTSYIDNSLQFDHPN